MYAGFEVLNPESKMQAELQTKTGQAVKFALKSRKSVIGLAGAVFLTAMSGAFVAGNDAGRAYNTFPMMGDEWIPLEIADMLPGWKNLFENTATVQFNHRVLALSTYFGICWVYVRSMSQTALWETLPIATRMSFHTMVLAAGAQVGLGISTLLMHVPIPLAAAHQVRQVQSRCCMIPAVDV
jgi:heme a synthase